MSLYDIYVPPIGNPNADLMVVGEGPGKNECRQREPFVGESGTELDRLLASIGLERDDVWITNATKFLPNTEEKKDYFFISGAPTPEYMTGILELVEEIKKVQPNVILCMGNFALWALTQEWGIFNWRGSILESKLVKGVKVIPTIHPAWFIRTRSQWNKYPLLEWDFQRAKKESEFPEIRRPEYDIITSPTPEEIEYAVERFSNSDLLVVDTEWYNPNDIAYIGFSDSSDFSVVIPPTSMQAYRAYRAILSSEAPKAMHNALFDVVALERQGIKVNNVVDDTMIGWWACWGDLGANKLHNVSSVLTDEPYYKEELEFVGKDERKGQEYCGKDCIVTSSINTTLHNSEFNIAGGRRGYEITMSVMPTFIRASIMGVRCNVSLMDKMADEHLEKADQIEEEVFDEIGHSFNPRSPPQTATVVYDELGFGKVRKGRSTEKKYLLDMAASQPEGKKKRILTKIIRAREERNIVSRYLTKERAVDRDGRIRTNWRLNGTKNARFSATIPWWPGVPMQTVPDDAREIYIADPGCVFVGWDFEQAEARYVAVKTRDYDLLDDLEAGIDIHTKLAAMLPFGLSYEELMERVEKEGKDNVVERYLAKQCRHAMNYWMTWSGLKDRVNEDYIETGVGIDAATAKILHAAYMELHTNLSSWWDQVYQTVLFQHYLTNAWGRKRNVLGRIYRESHEHRDCIAFEPQSSVSDLNTLAIADIDRELEYGERGQVLAHMHDGGFVQVREEDEDWAVEVIRECATKEMVVDREVLTIPVEIKVGYNWKEMKKAA